jgi:hypothetical protein
MVSNGDLPPLPASINRMGGKDVFDASEIELYRERCERWRADAPARAAAKRAAMEAYTRGVMEAEMTRISAEQRLMAEGQAAQAQREADEAAFNAEAAKGWK